MDQPAEVSVLEQGPLFVKVAVKGKIGKYSFTQTIRLTQGEPRIDMNVKLDWTGNPRIGEPGIEFRADNPRKAFYDDRYKLLVYLPTRSPTNRFIRTLRSMFARAGWKIPFSIVGIASSIISF